jgi:hypothetical protein
VESGGEWWRVVESGGEWWRVVESGGEWWRVVERAHDQTSMVQSGCQNHFVLLSFQTDIESSAFLLFKHVQLHVHETLFERNASFVLIQLCLPERGAACQSQFPEAPAARGQVMPFLAWL